jgi:hypothetical protein
VHPEVSQHVPEPLHQVFALGDAHVQHQLGDLPWGAGVPLERSFVLELVVVNRGHDALKVRQRLARDLMRRDQTGDDRAGAGACHAREHVTLLAYRQDRTDQADSLDPATFEHQVDLGLIRTFKCNHDSSSRPVRATGM